MTTEASYVATTQVGVGFSGKLRAFGDSWRIFRHRARIWAAAGSCRCHWSLCSRQRSVLSWLNSADVQLSWQKAVAAALALLPSGHQGEASRAPLSIPEVGCAGSWWAYNQWSAVRRRRCWVHRKR